MLRSVPIINTVANFLEKYAFNIPIVIDPVMIAESGDTLRLPEDTILLLILLAT